MCATRNCSLEIVDPDTGQPLPPGERGELVLTLLASEAMPLLRYRTGDLASLVQGPCACGGILPRLGRVEGRIGNGAGPSIHELDEWIFALPEVRGFEATLHTEEGRHYLDLTLETDTALDATALDARMPGDLELRLHYAEVSPFSRRGKRRIHSGERPSETPTRSRTMRDILPELTAWLGQGKRIAIATVIETWGASPRPVGSKLAVNTEGGITGSVSAGCVENAVIQEALATLQSGQSRLLEAFGVSKETALDVGLTCGGTLKVLVEPFAAYAGRSSSSSRSWRRTGPWG